MFFIGIDSAGRLLTKNLKVESADQDFYGLPEIASSFMSSRVSNWFERNGIESLSEPEFFEVRSGTTTSAIEYCIASVKLNANSPSDFCFERLDQIWKKKLDLSITMAMNRIVGEIAHRIPKTFRQLEQSLTADFDLRQINKRVFFAKSDSVVVNETLASLLGAFATANGEKTARLCLHSDQGQPIQEMLMIHAEPISTGPLRQDRDSSVSYHMLRGVLEITLHHEDSRGDESFVIERHQNSPSLSSSLRVPARVFRTIRTLTDSAIFVEVQSGPFTDSDTEWKLKTEKVLIVGVTGMIGNYLIRSLRRVGFEVFGTSRNTSPSDSSLVQLDFQKPAEFEKTLNSFPVPDVAVFSSGMSILRQCEQNPELSNLTNNVAQVELARYLLSNGCQRVVLVSSSRVFDGRSPNVPIDSPHCPNTVYGLHKAAAENGFMALGSQAKILRLTKVFSVKSAILTEWISRLNKGEMVSAFDDVKISPVSLADATQAIEEIMFEESEQIFQLSANDEISYFQTAQLVASEIGADLDLVKPQPAGEKSEITIDHSSLECSRFQTVKIRSSEETIRSIVRQLNNS